MKTNVCSLLHQPVEGVGTPGGREDKLTCNLPLSHFHEGIDMIVLSHLLRWGEAQAVQV